MSDTRGDIIRVLHRAYVDNGWVPPTLDGYADALVAAGYGKADVTTIKAAAWNECAGAIRLDSEAHCFWLMSVNPYAASTEPKRCSECGRDASGHYDDGRCKS